MYCRIWHQFQVSHKKLSSLPQTHFDQVLPLKMNKKHCVQICSVARSDQSRIETAKRYTVLTTRRLINSNIRKNSVKKRNKPTELFFKNIFCCVFIVIPVKKIPKIQAKMWHLCKEVHRHLAMTICLKNCIGVLRNGSAKNPRRFFLKRIQNVQKKN